MLCSAQFTIRDASDVLVDVIEPINPVMDQFWLDASVIPNMLKRWNGSAWIPTGNQTYASATPPAIAFKGDLWINTAEGNKLYRFDGATWLSYQEQSISDLLEATESLMLALSGGSRIFHQSDAPTVGMGKGDLWYDTNDNNKCYRYDSAWLPMDFTNVIDTIDRVSSTIKTDEQIVSTVRSSQVYTSDLAAKADNADIADMATS